MMIRVVSQIQVQREHLKIKSFICFGTARNVVNFSVYCFYYMLKEFTLKS